MDRTQILLVGLPVLLFCSDIMNLFSSPPHKPISHKHSPIPTKSQPHLQQSLEFPVQKQTTIVPPIGGGNTVNIDFCTSCSYRGTAVASKQLLETAFPGIDVVLANCPPPLTKRMVSKVIPVVQLGIIGLVVAGEQIFPKLGIVTPPSWYYSLRANRFGSMASTWLLGNFVQSFLQSSGAFEVYCNGELIFSKLKENRFPGEIELKDLVGGRIANTRYGPV
ncbi:selT-like protein [Neltuma alba]|uniref:selT-like protein n=1 Tax=Neltuma alba TaxID=207710 RepID=UPI0010A56C77|nr:selT-like protein [Prosopis alba]XP_028786545.1 selT-like protein [Prosopis alba]